MKPYKIFLVLILTIPFSNYAQYLGGNGRGDVSIILTNVPLPVEEALIFLPTKVELAQNYPNPFNPKTVIGYQLPVSSKVTLKVYDLLGNEIATLVDEEKSSGSYEVVFTIGQDSHADIASGIYFYQLKKGSFVETRKMVLMK